MRADDEMIFNVMIGTNICKKFEKPAGAFMNNTMYNFNKYAKLKGFTRRVNGSQYFGGMAWSNGLEIMELVFVK